MNESALPRREFLERLAGAFAGPRSTGRRYPPARPPPEAVSTTTHRDRLGPRRAVLRRRLRATGLQASGDRAARQGRRLRHGVHASRRLHLRRLPALDDRRTARRPLQPDRGLPGDRGRRVRAAPAPLPRHLPRSRHPGPAAGSRRLRGQPELPLSRGEGGDRRALRRHEGPQRRRRPPSERQGEGRHGPVPGGLPPSRPVPSVDVGTDDGYPDQGSSAEGSPFEPVGVLRPSALEALLLLLRAALPGIPERGRVLPQGTLAGHQQRILPAHREPRGQDPPEHEGGEDTGDRTGPPPA